MGFYCITFQKLVANLQGFAIINAWQHFGNRKIIRKYVGIKELTPAIVNEFIKKIIVHAPEKVDGKRVQKVDIVFNFVREINFLSATQPKRQGA